MTFSTVEARIGSTAEGDVLCEIGVETRLSEHGEVRKRHGRGYLFFLTRRRFFIVNGCRFLLLGDLRTGWRCSISSGRGRRWLFLFSVRLRSAVFRHATHLRKRLWVFALLDDMG